MIQIRPLTPTLSQKTPMKSASFTEKSKSLHQITPSNRPKSAMLLTSNKKTMTPRYQQKWK